MVAVNRKLYAQADYDCQRCGGAETAEMRKRVHDFARPLCDGCIEVMRHDGHDKNAPVIVGSTSQITEIADDGKMHSLKKSTEKTIRYEDWPFRCRKCFPIGA